MKTNNKKPLPPLTSKEKAVLIFIEEELTKKAICPSYQEICDHFGFASFNSVQNYLKQLAQKGYVSFPPNQKRAIQILHSAHEFQNDLKNRLYENSGSSSHSFADQSSLDQKENSKVFSIPFLGRVAAGVPIERLNNNEFLEVPSYLVKSSRNLFALEVEGDSMINEGILEGDYLIIHSQQSAQDGDLVVASVEEESTVKRFFKKLNPEISKTEKSIELRPANPRLTSMWYSADKVNIKGIVKALFRKY